MIKRIYLTIFFVLVIVNFAFAATQAVQYLCESGIAYYQIGRYEDALGEFKRVLLIDPNNETARQYINTIFQKKEEPSTQKSTREEVINQTLAQFSGEKEFKTKLERKPTEKGGLEVAGIKITGEAQLRMGVTPHDVYWKRANWDLNEKNWRILSHDALNRGVNSYDPRIYDRLKVNLNTDEKQALSFHSNITVDPWSFTGKSDKVTLSGAGGDAAEIELKYWSNTGYTINDNVYTLFNGDTLNLPEIKVKDNKTMTPVTVRSDFGNIFTVPELKIYRDFQPVREFWFDYKQDNLKLRIYPIAYENQALTFDDPMRLSNNRIWWEDSPWLHRWKPGLYNSGPSDFTKGYWDNTYSFFARDSEGQRLTSLRGFSFEFNPQAETSFVTSIATPKDPWQEYSDVDNFLSASRLKQYVGEDVTVGLSVTSRTGFNLNDDNRLDTWNYVTAADVAYEIKDGLKTTFEVARSQSKYDLSDSQYKTQARGNAYHFSIIGRFPAQSIIDTDYFGIQPGEGESNFTKFRFFACRMDPSFDEPLSSYAETRDDEWWSRHLHFRRPFKYYYQGEGQLLTWDDIKNSGIGNGIDIGGSTLGLRIEFSLWNKRLENLFDVRNVHHATEGDFLQNVARDELTAKINDKLTAKVLGIYQRMPKTIEWVDPFVFDPQTGIPYINTYIDDHKDSSLKTGSLGLEYAFFDWLALNGIWEYTNDISLAYDNFPRGLLNGGLLVPLYNEYGNTYREQINWLYGQQFFPKPPYPHYNIFKTGLRLTPRENLEVYLDYTRNPYEKAGGVDDNINHVGLEVAYSPMPKLAVFFRYTYSRWQDLDMLAQGITKVYGHHNAFAEFIYRISDNEDFSFQYGEASRNPFMGGVLDIGWDPYGGSLSTIDTQHIFRLYYRRKF
jgi:tetratricopeptide (TPR) repeat protein